MREKTHSRSGFQWSNIKPTISFKRSFVGRWHFGSQSLKTRLQGVVIKGGDSSAIGTLAAARPFQKNRLAAKYVLNRLVFAR